MSFEVSETGGADATLESVNIEFSAANWADQGRFSLAEAFASDRLRAMTSMASRALGWTSSSNYHGVKISVTWRDVRTAQTGVATRLVTVPGL